MNIMQLIPFACEHGSLDVAKVIFIFDPDIIHKHGNRALHQVINNKNLADKRFDICSFIIDNGAEFHAKVIYERAFADRDTKLISFLHTKGFSIDLLSIEDSKNEDSTWAFLKNWLPWN